LLRRFTETVIACFDGDLAWRRAAARSFPVFLEAGLWGRGAFLPAGEDSDTFVRAQGRVALEGVLAAAEPLVEAFVGALAGPNGAAPPRRSRSATRRSAKPAWRHCRATFESAWCAACSRSVRTWNASGRSPTVSPTSADEGRAAKSAACAMRFAPPRRAEIRKPWKPPCAA